MERYIGLDVHAASCTLAVISQAGRRLKDFPVETNGQSLVEAVRMIPGQRSERARARNRATRHSNRRHHRSRQNAEAVVRLRRSGGPCAGSGAEPIRHATVTAWDDLRW